MKILLGVTGGIAAYKICDIITGLKHKGHDVRVIMTDAAQKFITPLTLATLSGNPVMTTMWSERGSIDHIEAAKWCDVMAVVPATLNTISKLAYGIADNLLTTVFAAVPEGKPRLIFPAMNTSMLESGAMANASRILGQDYLGVFVYETVEKRLACGSVGKGGLMGTTDILNHIIKFCKSMED